MVPACHPVLASIATLPHSTQWYCSPSNFPKQYCAALEVETRVFLSCIYCPLCRYTAALHSSDEYLLLVAFLPYRPVQVITYLYCCSRWRCLCSLLANTGQYSVAFQNTVASGLYCPVPGYLKCCSLWAFVIWQIPCRIMLPLSG